MLNTYKPSLYHVKYTQRYSTRLLGKKKSDSLRINTRVYWNPKNTNHNLTDYQYLKCKWLFELLNGGATIINTKRGFILNYTTCKYQKPLNLLPSIRYTNDAKFLIPRYNSTLWHWRALLSHNYPLYSALARSSK
jgi:hypothetical protein